MQEYKTVAHRAVAEIEEKKSRFLAHVAFVDTEEKAAAFLKQVKDEHRTARHHVYAYLLRQDSKIKYSDDGEPQKTSGLPTLECIQHAELTDCMIVTARYFGGTLLGTGGLVRAYTQAANAVLAKAEIVTMQSCVECKWTVGYGMYDAAIYLLTQAGVRLEEAVFSENVCIPFLILEKRKEDLLKEIQQLCRGKADIFCSNPFFTPF